MSTSWSADKLEDGQPQEFPTLGSSPHPVVMTTSWSADCPAGGCRTHDDASYGPGLQLGPGGRDGLCSDAAALRRRHRQAVARVHRRAAARDHGPAQHQRAGSPREAHNQGGPPPCCCCCAELSRLLEPVNQERATFGRRACFKAAWLTAL